MAEDSPLATRQHGQGQLQCQACRRWFHQDHGMVFLLPCQHSFCFHCKEGRGTVGGGYSCPVCRGRRTAGDEFSRPVYRHQVPPPCPRGETQPWRRDLCLSETQGEHGAGGGRSQEDEWFMRHDNKPVSFYYKDGERGARRKEKTSKAEGFSSYCTLSRQPSTASYDYSRGRDEDCRHTANTNVLRRSSTFTYGRPMADLTERGFGYESMSRESSPPRAYEGRSITRRFSAIDLGGRVTRMRGGHIYETVGPKLSTAKFECPPLKLDHRRRHSSCFIDPQGVNLRLSEEQSQLRTSFQQNVLRRSARPFRFLGCRGLQKLTGRVYWEVNVTHLPQGRAEEGRVFCEIGVATQDAMDKCTANGCIAASKKFPAITAKLTMKHHNFWAEICSSGDSIKEVALAPFPSDFQQSQFQLGVLCDVPDGTVSFIDASKLKVLGDRCSMSAEDSLFPVFSLESESACGARVRVRLEAGNDIKSSPAKTLLLESC